MVSWVQILDPDQSVCYQKSCRTISLKVGVLCDYLQWTNQDITQKLDFQELVCMCLSVHARVCIKKYITGGIKDT